MEKIHASIVIDAPAEKVWDTMLDDATYRKWTTVFNPGSYFEGDWSEGSTIRFLGPNPDGSEGEGGMLSRVAVNRPHEYLSLEHFGTIKNGVEDTTSEEVKKWVPAYENYTLTEKDGSTEVAVDMDIDAEYREEFEKMWDEALQKLKSLCEE